MKCKDYLFKMHHGLHITYDDDDLIKEISSEGGGLPFRVRADNRYTVTDEEYKAFEKNAGVIMNNGLPFPNANGTSGPQGHRNTWDGCQFDSVWEYLFPQFP